MNETCGCCESIERVTPITIVNRPGLDALIYRVGTHGSFLETMLARLSASDFPELRGLTTRSASDPSIAFLDAWATVADVLTFYQERIANEAYLRTATERRSILELAQLVGYKLRSGVAASVYLAYALEKDHDVIILPGNRAQSVPDPGQLPQSFEAAEKLEARFAWNTLKPRTTRPQLISKKGNGLAALSADDDGDGAIYLLGTATNLKQGDPLLFVFGNGDNEQVFVKVAAVKTEAAENRTKVTVIPKPLPVEDNSARMALVSSARAATTKNPIELNFGNLVGVLARVPVLQPRNSQRLERSAVDIFGKQSDMQQQLLVNFNPALQQILSAALGNAQATQSQPLRDVEALRVKAAPFGHNAPLKQDFSEGKPVEEPHEWPLPNAATITITLPPETPPIGVIGISAEGGGTTLTIGGVTFKNMTITLKLDDHMWTGETTLEAGEHDVQLIDADKKEGPVVNVNISSDEIVLTFRIGVEPPKIHITNEDATHAGVRLEPDQKIIVAQPSTSNKVITPHHETTTEFSASNGFVITDQSVINGNILPLDAQYDKIIPESWVVVERPDKKIISRVQSVQTVSIAAYGITGRVTQLALYKDWLEPTDRLLSSIRSVTVYAQSEKVEQAEEPIEEDIGETKVSTPPVPVGVRFTAPVETESVQGQVRTGTDIIELDRLYDGLKPGRWIIVSGERTDILQVDGKTPIRGVTRSELAMIASVTQGVQQIEVNGTKINLPGDRIHTFLHLVQKLGSPYKRETVTIYGNVVRATHGETRTETLGSGDGSKTLQQFTLRQSPLTYLAAPNPAGVESTLQVRVNDILWHELDSLVEAGSTDRDYVTETDDENKTTVIFGNGQYGARLPTGVENVKAVYRTGIGKPGNVRAGQINLLATKPLGVKSVTNPLRASGGADRESRDSARRNVPLALMALDRLVSVQDYEDFGRSYAGIGKASAARLTNGRRQLVHLSIVGADNIPIDVSSDLYQNLVQALHQFGDPNLPLQVDLAEVLFLVISASVRLLPDYQWESVEAKIRVKLLDTFSFERRELGQPVFQAEVFSAIQGVAGVDYVELEILDAPDEERVIAALDRPPGAPPPPGIGSLGPGNLSFVKVELAHVDPNATDLAKRIVPAQLAFLNPDLPDTLILRELPK